MFAAPAAQCSDGAFDLLVFKGHSRLSLLLNLLKLDAGEAVRTAGSPTSRRPSWKSSPARRPRDRADTSRWTRSWWRAREVNAGGAGGGGGGGGGGGEGNRRCAW